MRKPLSHRPKVASSMSVARRRPSRPEIRRAATHAIRAAASRTDKDVERAIADDADTFEAEPARLVLVRPHDLDMARIRSGLGLTQADFAKATGIPHRPISDWEEGRNKPSAAARAFLLLVDEFGDKALNCRLVRESDILVGRRST
ncbi:MAG TPA: helix-turn-helix domain-containing protein [Stellaceae bacterium]|nr:helix-turn-helix domain-containing protein [Stellaceae bacterium]